MVFYIIGGKFMLDFVDKGFGFDTLPVSYTHLLLVVWVKFWDPVA